MPKRFLQSRGLVDSGPFSGGPQGRVGVAGPRSTRPSGPPLKGDARRAYTLIEVLVVAVVIVLMLGMALPVFRAITGSRSEAGATNIIASVLGRARDDAIGIQQPYGVALIYSQSKQQQYLAEVTFPSCPTWTGSITQSVGTCVQAAGYVGGSPVSFYYYSTANILSPSVSMPPSGSNTDQNYWQWVSGPPLEIVPDTDLIPLPAGVGVQTLSNCSISGSNRTSDGYLAVGVIMFDGKGRITSVPYGIPMSSRLATAAGLTDGYPTHSTGGSNYPIGSYNYNGKFTQFGVLSQFGLVVFQRDAWLSQKSSLPDALYTDATPQNATSGLPDYTTGTPTQQQEENWLDQNATPLLLDRYTGTLIKGE